MSWELGAVFAVLMGLCVGSFLNVCIYRLPLEQSVVWPSSHCMSCSKPIHWHDNIPLLSFLILKGRCRHCGAGISWQYPLVELLSGLLFLVFYWTFGFFSVTGLVYLALSLALLVESAIDFRHQIIPDEITLPGIVLGLLLSAVFPFLHAEALWWKGLLWSLVGMLAGGGSLYLAGAIAEKLLKKEAMGGGDVKLLAMIGSLLGWQAVIWTLFVSSVLGSVVGVALRLARGQERIPFGPYLAAAAFLYLYFGRTTMDWYLNTLTGGY